MPLDDGLAPLLPQRRRPDIKLPSRKLVLLGVWLGCSVVIDGLLCAYFCTGGFSSAWWRRLGTYGILGCSDNERFSWHVWYDSRGCVLARAMHVSSVDAPSKLLSEATA